MMMKMTTTTDSYIDPIDIRFTRHRWGQFCSNYKPHLTYLPDQYTSIKLVGWWGGRKNNKDHANLTKTYRQQMAEAQKQIVREALVASAFCITDAAKSLKTTRQFLTRLMDRHGIATPRRPLRRKDQA